VIRERGQLQFRAGRRRALAVGVALGAHAFFLAALLWQANQPEPAPGLPLDVQLVRLPPPMGAARAPTRPAARSLSPRRLETAATSAEPPASVLPLAPSPAVEAPETPPPNIGGALRAGLGCDLSGAVALTAEERRHCQARFTAREGDPSQRVFAAVGPAQRAYFDARAKRALWWQEPFLATDPKNGCRPKVTNHQAGIAGGRGPTSDWRVSMGCAVSF
jgi:hypothetical protein